MSNLDLDEIIIYISNIQDKIFIDTYTFDCIINYILEKVYFNHLLILFLMSCMSGIYICNNKKNKHDYVMITNVEHSKDKLIEKNMDKV